MISLLPSLACREECTICGWKKLTYGVLSAMTTYLHVVGRKHFAPSLELLARWGHWSRRCGRGTPPTQWSAEARWHRAPAVVARPRSWRRSSNSPSVSERDARPSNQRICGLGSREHSCTEKASKKKKNIYIYNVCIYIYSIYKYTSRPLSVS